MAARSCFTRSRFRLNAHPQIHVRYAAHRAVPRQRLHPCPGLAGQSWHPRVGDRHLLHQAGRRRHHGGVRAVVQERVEGLAMITNDEKLKCAKRELAMRLNVYPKWIQSGRMKPEQSAYEI